MEKLAHLWTSPTCSCAALASEADSILTSLTKLETVKVPAEGPGGDTALGVDRPDIGGVVTCTCKGGWRSKYRMIQKWIKNGSALRTQE